MANQGPISWKTGVGLNHVGAYQVSGRPFASGSITSATAYGVIFPTVTRWVQITNNDDAPLKAGFSALGVAGNNYFTVPASSSAGGPGVSPVFELKITQLWLNAPTNVDVVAGLTNIEGKRTATGDGQSWSGSAGVG